MFTTSRIDTADLPAFYASLHEQAVHLMDGEPDVVANLANISALLNVHLEDVNWVGFYLWSTRDEELVLGPFQGKPACIRIPLGRGVCGTAAKQQTVQVVPDVFQFDGHIACDDASRSEIVLPIVSKEGTLFGVLDIDSPTPGRFSEADASGLQPIAELIARTVNFSIWQTPRETGV